MALGQIAPTRVCTAPAVPKPQAQAPHHAHHRHHHQHQHKATPASSSSPSKPPAEFPSRISNYVPSPIKRWHYPSRWSEWSDKSRLTSGRSRSISPLASEVPDSAPVVPSKLAFLPACAPEGIEHCADDCYWRWLLHTLTAEVHALKGSLDAAQEGFQERAVERREAERVIRYRDWVHADVASMSKALKRLHVDVPQLRRELAKIQSQFDHSIRRFQQLLSEKEALPKELVKKSLEGQDVTRLIEAVEHELGELVELEKELTDKSRAATAESDWLAGEIERLKILIDGNNEYPGLKKELETLEKKDAHKASSKPRRRAPKHKMK